MPLNNILKEFDNKLKKTTAVNGFLYDVGIDGDPVDFDTDVIRDFVVHTYNAGREDGEKVHNLFTSSTINNLVEQCRKNRDKEIVKMIGEIEEDIGDLIVHADEALETLKNKILKK